MTKVIAGTPFTLEYVYARDNRETMFGALQPHIVMINFNGHYYDHQAFATLIEAEAFMNDPLKAAREAAERENAREAKRIEESDAMAERNASLVACNSGRQIGPNRRGSI